MTTRSRLLQPKTSSPLHADAFDRVYYHGTSEEAAAQAILANGIHPREISLPAEAKSRAQLAPARGRVYVTEDLSYAAMYALGGNMFGHGEITVKFVEKSEPYGYIFEMRGEDLKGDVVPDEDSIGEVLTHLFWQTMGYNYGATNQTSRAPERVRQDLLQAAERVMTNRQRQGILDGMIGAQSAVGKKVQRLISPSTIQWLIDNGAHVAHLGAVYPRRAWRFKKVDAANIQKEQILTICEEIPLTQRKAAGMKTGDWARAEDLQTGDLLAFPAPALKVRSVHRENDEIIVLGPPGVIRRFDPKDEVNLLRKTAAARGPNYDGSFPPPFDLVFKKAGGLRKFSNVKGYREHVWSDWYAVNKTDQEKQEDIEATVEGPYGSYIEPGYRYRKWREWVTAQVKLKYENWVDFWRAKSFPLEIYRAVFVNSEEDIRTENAGIFWSATEQGAQRGGVHLRKGGQYVLRGTLDSLQQVDWVSTLVGNLLDSDEVEITLLPGTTVSIDGVGSSRAGWKPFEHKTVTAGLVVPITETPAFKSWFAGSKVVDGEGNPLVVYHGTPQDFGKKNFSVGGGGRGSMESFGFHFGPSEAANNRLSKGMEKYDAHHYNWNVLPVYLSIKHPLRLPDFGDWENLKRLGRHLVKAGIDEKAVSDALARSGHATRIRALIKVLQNEGYDGIVYFNLHELGGDSWIAFDPRQIKSAIGNNGEFDAKSKSMTGAVNTPRIPSFKECLEAWGGVEGLRARTKQKIILPGLQNGYRLWSKHLSKLQFPLEVYRALAISKGNPVDLESPGRYWSCTEDGALAYWGKRRKEHTLLRAHIQPADVDWPATLLARMDHRHSEREEEITLLPAARIHVEATKTNEGDWVHRGVSTTEQQVGAAMIRANPAKSTAKRSSTTTANTKTFWHGTATPFDHLQPNNYGIIWAGGKTTAREYAEQDATYREETERPVKKRLIPVKLRTGVKIIDLRDRQDPIVAEFFTKVKPNRQQDTSHNQIENSWAIPFLREKGVDAVLVTDSYTGSEKAGHLAIGIINPDAVAGAKQAAIKIQDTAQNADGWFNGDIFESDEELLYELQNYGLYEFPDALAYVSGHKVAILGFIEANRSGKGIGTKLIEDFLAQARAAGAVAAVLVTDTDRKQRKGFDLMDWYERLGFVKIEELENEWLMAKKL